MSTQVLGGGRQSKGLRSRVRRFGPRSPIPLLPPYSLIIAPATAPPTTPSATRPRNQVSAIE